MPCPCDRTEDMLSMAVSILALQREVSDLKNRLDRMERPDPWRTARRVIRIIRLVGPFILTPYGQGLLVFLLGGLGALVKWLGG